MSAPVKKCEVCDDTGSKSRDIGGDLDCTACSAADERAALRGKLPMTWTEETFAWRAYQLGKVAAGRDDIIVTLSNQYSVLEQALAVESAALSESLRHVANLKERLNAAPVVPVAAQPAGEVDREKLIDALAQSLTGSYDCMRVWSAWGVGTMSEDDFNPISDDRHRLEEIADELIIAMAQGEKA